MSLPEFGGLNPDLNSAISLLLWVISAGVFSFTWLFFGFSFSCIYSECGLLHLKDEGWFTSRVLNRRTDYQLSHNIPLLLSSMAFSWTNTSLFPCEPLNHDCCSPLNCLHAGNCSNSKFQQSWIMRFPSPQRSWHFLIGPFSEKEKVFFLVVFPSLSEYAF